MAEEKMPDGFVVTGLGRHAWIEDDRLIELISDGTPVGIQISRLLALDLAAALLSLPPTPAKAAGLKVDDLQVSTSEDGSIVLVVGLGSAKLPLVMPASAAEALRIVLSDNPLQGIGGQPH